uniref:Uncharacterized protein n=1 Tax=Romanomermis culicivorax TaxID=13658 RepID=A0A915L7I7_ROMCU
MYVCRRWKFFNENFKNVSGLLIKWAAIFSIKELIFLLEGFLGGAGTVPPLANVGRPPKILGTRLIYFHVFVFVGVLSLNRSFKKRLHFSKVFSSISSAMLAAVLACSMAFSLSPECHKASA